MEEINKDRPLVVRGDMMLELLNRMPIDILETLIEDIGYDESTSPELATLLFRCLDNKKSHAFLQSADTIVVEDLWD